MTQSLRSHPEILTLEVDSLLTQLPKSMRKQASIIKERVRGMTPDGLATFIEILRKEVDIIISGKENSFGKRIIAILTRSLKL